MNAVKIFASASLLCFTTVRAAEDLGIPRDGGQVVSQTLSLTDQDRVVLAEIFRPRRATDQSFVDSPYLPTASAFATAVRNGEVPSRRGVDRFIDKMSTLRAPTMRSQRSLVATIAEAHGDEQNHPVIVFSVGGDMSRFWYTCLATRLASRGLIVIVVSHLGSGQDVYPGVGLVVADRTLDEADREENAKITTMHYSDVQRVIARICDIDPDRRVFNWRQLIVAGHSRGGRAVSSLSVDPQSVAPARLTAGIFYDSVGPTDRLATGGVVPTMIVQTGKLSDAHQRRIDAFMRLTEAARMHVHLTGGTHFSCSDLPIIAPSFYRSPRKPAEIHDLLADLTVRFVRFAVGGSRSENGPKRPESSLISRWRYAHRTPGFDASTISAADE